MNTFVVFLAWTVVVGGSWAWSSSEVSCASCGTECQAACGTRNFRACCFNFQRRRRAQLPRMLVGDEAQNQALQSLLRLLSERSQDQSLYQQHLSPLSRSQEIPYVNSPTKRDFLSSSSSSSLASVLTSLLQESSEEDEGENGGLSVLEEEEEQAEEDAPVGVGEEEGTALSRLVVQALHHPPPNRPQTAFHQRYPVPPPPSTKIRK